MKWSGNTKIETFFLSSYINENVIHWKANKGVSCSKLKPQVLCNLHFACVKDNSIVDSKLAVWMKECEKNKLKWGWETKVSTKFPIFQETKLAKKKNVIAKRKKNPLPKTLQTKSQPNDVGVVSKAPPILRVKWNETAAVYEEDYFAFLPITLHFTLAK